MKGFSEAGYNDYFPTEIASQITNAYSRMGSGQAGIENRQEAEEQRKKEEKRRKVQMGIILGAAALASGGAALAAAPAGGGLMAGLGTFGQGALSAFTGGSSAATGAGGLIGGINSAGGMLGQIGTNMLMGGSGGGGAAGGGSGGGGDLGSAAMGALGSYMQQVQGANKTSRVMEGVLKDPGAREAAFGSGFGQDQADAVMKYAGTLGATDKASFYQYALPMIGKTATGNVEFDRQMKLQGSRIAQQGDVDLNKIGAASMLDSAGKSVQIPATPVVRSFSPMNFSLGMGTGLQ